MFCKHKWTIMSETVTKSKFECAISTINIAEGKTTVPHQMCCADRKFIQIVSCEKCGKLKRFVENI
jgi:hypothetical protein